MLLENSSKPRVFSVLRNKNINQNSLLMDYSFIWLSIISIQQQKFLPAPPEKENGRDEGSKLTSLPCSLHKKTDWTLAELIFSLPWHLNGFEIQRHYRDRRMVSICPSLVSGDIHGTHVKSISWSQKDLADELGPPVFPLNLEVGVPKFYHLFSEWRLWQKIPFYFLFGTHLPCLFSNLETPWSLETPGKRAGAWCSRTLSPLLGLMQSKGLVNYVGVLLRIAFGQKVSW